MGGEGGARGKKKSSRTQAGGRKQEQTVYEVEEVVVVDVVDVVEVVEVVA